MVNSIGLNGKLVPKMGIDIHGEFSRLSCQVMGKMLTRHGEFISLDGKVQCHYCFLIFWGSNVSFNEIID
jgi:hypothetical protein